MKRIALTLIAATVLVSACGSRPDADTTAAVAAPVYGENGELISGGDPDLGAAVAGDLTIRAFSNQSSLETGSSDSATITALITNDSNQAAAGQPVNFISTGGALQGLSPVTNEFGQATATLTLGGSYENMPIEITVVSGSATDTVLVSATGTELGFEGPTQLALGATADLSVTLIAGNGEPVPNEEVIFTSTSNNVITPTTENTDSNGRVTVSVNSDAGSDTIVASALGGTVTETHDLLVDPDILNFTAPAAGAELAVGVVNTVEVEWESGGAPVSGETLTFGITAGQIISGSSVVTNAAGRASVQVVSNSAGDAIITVASNNGPANTIMVEFVATTPTEARISSSSSRVVTGTDTTITALIMDANGNPVKNQTVLFSSPDLKGGQLSSVSELTDSNGEATTKFSAGNLVTEFEEIEIIASVSGNTAITDSTRLSVIEQRLNITLGTSGLLEVIAGGVQYGMPFAVQVADGSGSPLNDAKIEISIMPLFYMKGFYELLPDSADELRWAQTVTAICPSEDVNGNRTLDAGEDVNNNGVLDPQDPALIAAHTSETPTVINGEITTDANGSGYFTMMYPASSSMWSEVRIIARAKDAGVEAEEIFNTTLPVLADRVDDAEDNPPNFYSPFGTGGLAPTCNDEQ